MEFQRANKIVLAFRIGYKRNIGHLFNSAYAFNISIDSFNIIYRLESEAIIFMR